MDAGFARTEIIVINIEAREAKRMELCTHQRPFKPDVPCGWRKDAGRSGTIERWRNRH